MNGVVLFKKFNNNSMTNKTFDPLKSNEYSPEQCGYALRVFKINVNEETIETKNKKHIEQKIIIKNLKGILLPESSKAILKSKKNITRKPNQELNKLVNNDYIPFTFMFSDGCLDLIAPNYQIYKTFEDGVDECIKNKKNLNFE